MFGVFISYLLISNHSALSQVFTRLNRQTSTFSFLSALTGGAGLWPYEHDQVYSAIRVSPFEKVVEAENVGVSTWGRKRINGCTQKIELDSTKNLLEIGRRDKRGNSVKKSCT